MNRIYSEDLESALAGKLEGLLESIPGLSPWKVEENPAPFNRTFDLLVSGKLPHGPKIELWVECKREPRPSRFPYVAVEREFEKESPKLIRARVFAAPYVSPRMAEICESHGWSRFDLAGNCKITVPTFLHIERRGNEPVHETSRPSANLSTPEAGRVVRAMLVPVHARTVWTQRHLAEHFGELDKPVPEPSLGLVNKVVRYLREEAFIEELPEGGFELRDPLKLLFACRDAYRFDRHERRGYFTLLQGKRLKEALADVDSETGGFAAYAGFSAAEFQWPHVRQPKTWLYIDAKHLQLFE